MTYIQWIYLQLRKYIIKSHIKLIFKEFHFNYNDISLSNILNIFNISDRL